MLSNERLIDNLFFSHFFSSFLVFLLRRNPKKKRIIVTNMVDTLEEVEGFKFSKSKKRKLVTDLSILSIFGKTPTAEEIKAKEKENKDAV